MIDLTSKEIREALLKAIEAAKEFGAACERIRQLKIDLRRAVRKEGRESSRVGWEFNKGSKARRPALCFCNPPTRRISNAGFAQRQDNR